MEIERLTRKTQAFRGENIAVKKDDSFHERLVKEADERRARLERSSRKYYFTK